MCVWVQGARGGGGGGLFGATKESSALHIMLSMTYPDHMQHNVMALHDSTSSDREDDR